MPSFPEIEAEDLRNKRGSSVAANGAVGFFQIRPLQIYTRLVSSRYKSIGRGPHVARRQRDADIRQLSNSCVRVIFPRDTSRHFCTTVSVRAKGQPRSQDIPLRRGTIGRGWIYLLAHSGVRPRSLRSMREKKARIPLLRVYI